jgi:hypothetical protein
VFNEAVRVSRDVLAHRYLCGGDVATAERGDYCAVIHLCSYTVDGVVENSPQNFDRFAQQPHFGLHEPLGLGKHGKFDVKARICPHTRFGGFCGPDQSGESLEPIEIVVGSTLDGEPDSSHAVRRLFVRQISQFRHGERDESLEKSFWPRYRCADDERTATSSASGFDNPLVAKGLEGVADGRGGNTEHGGELVFNRELFSSSEQSENYRGRESVDDSVRAENIGERSEDLRLHPGELTHCEPDLSSDDSTNRCCHATK